MRLALSSRLGARQRPWIALALCALTPGLHAQDASAWESFENGALQALGREDLAEVVRLARDLEPISDWPSFEEWIQNRELDYLRFNLRFPGQDYEHPKGWSLPATQDDEQLALRGELVGRLYAPRYGTYGWYACARAWQRLGAFDELFEALERLELGLADDLAWSEDPASQRAQVLDARRLRIDVYLSMGLLDLALEETPELDAEYARVRKLPDRTDAQDLWISEYLWTRACLDVARHSWGPLADWLRVETQDSFDHEHRPRAWYILGQATFEAAATDAAQVELAITALRRASAEARQNFELGRGSPKDNALVLAQAPLRIARIAMARWAPGDAELARQQLDQAKVVEAEQGSLLPAKSRAHRLAFELRLARLTDPQQAPTIGRELHAAWRELVAAWAAAPYRPGGASPLQFQNEQRIQAELIAHLVDQESPRAALLEVLRAQGSSSLFKAGQGLQLTAGDLALPELASDEVMLIYQPNTRGTDLFVLAGDSIGHTSLAADRTEIAGVAKRLNQQLAVSPRSPEAPTHRSEDLVALTEHATQMLLGPADGPLLRTLAQHERLTVVGWELLNRLPFEVLQGPSQEPLGQSHGIAYLPVMPLRSAWARRPKPQAEFALEWIGGARDIELPTDLLDGLQRCYGERPIRWAGDLEASPAAVGAGSSLVLQVLGHGSAGTGELTASIELAQGPLGRAELQQRSPFPELAVLTACRSGSGRPRPGNGSLGVLTSTCLEAGARHVIVPSVDVDLGATLAWTRVFHWALAQGMEVSLAAREARRALAASEAYHDPYYHALLPVIGQGHASPFASAPNPNPGPKPAPGGPAEFWPWVSAGAGLLVLGLAWISRHRGPAGCSSEA